MTMVGFFFFLFNFHLGFSSLLVIYLIQLLHHVAMIIYATNLRFFFFFFTSLIPWSRRRAWWSDRDLDLTARVTERWEKLLGIWIYLGKWLESTKSRLLWSSSIQLDWIIFAVMLYKRLMYINTLPSYIVYWWFVLLVI